MTDTQKKEIERRLTTWSRQSEKAEDRWTKYTNTGNTNCADSARRRMVAIDGKIDAAIEVLAIMGYAVIWGSADVGQIAHIVEGK